MFNLPFLSLQARNQAVLVATATFPVAMATLHGWSSVRCLSARCNTIALGVHAHTHSVRVSRREKQQCAYLLERLHISFGSVTHSFSTQTLYFFLSVIRLNFHYFSFGNIGVAYCSPSHRINKRDHTTCHISLLLSTAPIFKLLFVLFCFSTPTPPSHCSIICRFWALKVQTLLILPALILTAPSTHYPPLHSALFFSLFPPSLNDLSAESEAMKTAYLYFCLTIITKKTLISLQWKLNSIQHGSWKLSLSNRLVVQPLHAELTLVRACVS